MARSRRSGRRRSGRSRARRRRSTRRGGGANLLLIALVIVAGLLALRSSRGGDGASPGDPPAEDRPAAELLRTLTVTAEAGGAGYEREAFGDGWLTGPNGCDTRDRVLAAESQVAVERDGDGCTVVRGDWVSLYDGYSTPDPGELEIDHMVPLAEAWESGAAGWPADRRQQFANDTRHPDALVAVTAASNESKSDRDPADWMPPRRDTWCRYVDAWVTQKAAWGLTVDPAERTALRNVLATC